MKKLFTLIVSSCLLLLMGTRSKAQTAEAHNFTTYDTVFTIKYQYSSSSYALRITRPVNSDVANRPAIIHMNGIGEVGSNAGLTATYGPHYWLAHGWDGGIVLGNGTHYPIIITVQSYTLWPATYELLQVLTHILNTYHIKRNSVHLTGLSMGAFSWTSLICHQAGPGTEDGMKLVTSIAALQGQSQTVSPDAAPYELPNYNSFGHWAKKYGGKFFGLEGINDYRNVGAVSGNMNDSVPGSAYFSYETLGGGTHCCWNDMYNPGTTNWTSVGTLAPNLTKGSTPNTMGTYKAPSSIFQWMLRQGDTSMVGSTGSQTVTANAGSDQTLAAGANNVKLDGSNSIGSISTYTWSLVSGPNTPNITTPTKAITNVTGLVAGTYVFSLKLISILGISVSATTKVIVPAAANVAPAANAGADQTITLPTSSVTLAGSGTDTDGKIASYSWKYISGPSSYTFSSTTIANPVVSKLAAGSYVFRLTVTDDDGATAYDDVTISVNSAAVGTSAVHLPGTIQAESYGATGSTQNQSTTDAGGGLNVGWITSGSWMSYPVIVDTAGDYTVNFRLATANSNCAFNLLNAAGSVLATVSVPNTGGYQTWQTVSAKVTLPAGSQTLTIASTSSPYWNINWIQFVKVSSGAVITGKVIPGRIEAENYDGTMGTQTQTTTDAGGGSNVGWITLGSWLSYKVTVATAGTYTMSMRVATPNTGCKLQLFNEAGTLLGTVTVPNTGSYATYQTVSTTVTLPAGAQVLNVVSATAPYINLNWIEFTNPTGGDAVTVVTGKAIPGKIEAEAYDTTSGTQTQTTTDDGGGLNVGWITTGSWMAYKVTVATAGTYTVNFRVATANTNTSFVMRDASGNTLATIKLVNSTGGYQTWQTATTTLVLPAGAQTLTIFSTTSAYWNINWMSFTLGATASVSSQASVNTAATLQSDDTQNSLLDGKAFTLYPNPVKDIATVNVNNKTTGKMLVTIISPTGSVVKAFSFVKDQPYSQIKLPVSELAKGTYFVKVQVGSWVKTTQLVKL